MRKTKGLWESAIERQRSRLKQQYNWFPMPALISAGLVLLCSYHVSNDLFFRSGSQAQTIHWPAETLPHVGIWISVVGNQDQLIITTSQRKSLIIPRKNYKQKDLLPLIDYLNRQVQEKALSTVLTRQTFLESATLVIAADRSLSYSDFKPILHSMAKAKIRHYGFETQRVKNSG